MVGTLVQTLCSLVITLFTISGAALTLIYEKRGKLNITMLQTHVQWRISTWESNVKIKVVIVKGYRWWLHNLLIIGFYQIVTF